MRRTECGRAAAILIGLLLLAVGLPRAGEESEHPDKQKHGKQGHAKSSRISDESAPLVDPTSFPDRPRPIIELGNPFLGSRRLRPGFKTPGGSVWQPSFIAFGNLRTAFQTFDNGSGIGERSEFANRLDLFANLQLTGTERLVVGFRPFDRDGRFSGFDLSGSGATVNELNTELQVAFFEGDFGEMFPNLDKSDTGSLDVGFSVGRQVLGFQDGMLIDDAIDSLGVIRNTLLPKGGSDLQFTFVYGLNDLHRGDNLEDRDAQLFGMFTQADYPKSTINVDLVYVFNAADGNDGLVWGASSVQRLGHTNTTFRLLGSEAIDRETAGIADGWLLFSELSWVPPWNHNLIYLNTFWGIDRFTSAARGPATGGPLGRTGILFAAAGVGSFGTALDNRPDNSTGFGLGYQMFSHDTRRQFIFELGGRTATDGRDSDALAVGGQFQQALGQHFVVRVNVFGSIHERLEDGWGSRLEFQTVF